MKITDKTNQNGKHESSPILKRVHGVIISADGEQTGTTDQVLCEHFIEISVNSIPAIRLSCICDNLPELVVGRLFTEGLVDGTSEIESIYICAMGHIAEVMLNKTIRPAQHVYEERTCCTGNVQLITAEGTREPKMFDRAVVERDAVFELATRFKVDSHLHKQTGGTHCCYLRTSDGKIIEFEDISRHNAMDKAVGYALLNSYDLNECILYTTGRVPRDMVYKCIMAKIPVLVSKSVPTDAAIRLADEYRLKLICCAWPDSYKIYTYQNK